MDYGLLESIGGTRVFSAKNKCTQMEAGDQKPVAKLMSRSNCIPSTGHCKPPLEATREPPLDILDLEDGFHQMPLTEGRYPLTGLGTLWGMYH